MIRMPHSLIRFQRMSSRVACVPLIQFTLASHGQYIHIARFLNMCQPKCRFLCEAYYAKSADFYVLVCYGVQKAEIRTYSNIQMTKWMNEAY